MPRPWRVRSLGWRIAAVLGIAILPIGTVGVWQARAILLEERQNSENALIDVAEDRIGAARATISAAFSALDGILASETIPGPRCGRIAERFVTRFPDAIFLSYTDTAGQLRCRSDGGPAIDISTRQSFRDLLADPRPSVDLIEPGAATGRVVLVVTKPVERDGRVVGFLSISIPRTSMERLMHDPARSRNVHLALTRSDGSALVGPADPSWLPADAKRAMAQARAGDTGDVASFKALGRDGTRRHYVIAPIVEGELFELSAWAAPRDVEGRFAVFGALAFPLLMWLAAVGAAYAALHRLVICPVKAIRRDMRAFGGPKKRLPQPPEAGAAPEIEEVHDTLVQMTGRIAAEEERMRALLVQQRLLLKEAYHRVQNNLQIITTMIRLQVRDLDDGAARTALMQIENRAMAIAAVHGATYETGRLDDIAAAPLAERVSSDVGGADWRLRLVLDVEKGLRFDIDTALCVSMLLAELVLLATSSETAAELAEIGLVRDPVDETRACLTFRHTIVSDGSKPSAFSERLIRAFTLQLDGERSEDHDGDRRTVTIRFPLPPRTDARGEGAGR